MTEKDKTLDGVIVVLTTCPPDRARALSETLVRERLAACVNEISGMHSTYMWKDTLQREGETLLVIKTTSGRFEALQSRVQALHPYELPELIAIPVCAGAENYLAWVGDSVRT